MHYYNENDPKAAAWLRELISAGLIGNGIVDQRSIVEVRAEDLRGFLQCHFFAGVFAEVEALGYRRAGSDLCAAGVSAPHIRQRLYWVADRASQRFERGPKPDCRQIESKQPTSRRPDACRCGDDGGMAFPEGNERERPKQHRDSAGRSRSANGRKSSRLDDSVRVGRASGGGGHGSDDGIKPPSTSQTLGMADATGGGLGEHGGAPRQAGHSNERSAPHGRGDADRSGRLKQCGTVTVSEEFTAAELRGHPCDFWRDFDVLDCLDGKARRVESGTFPLADGIPGRVGLLRGYGNAIVPELAAEFVAAYAEAAG